MDFFKMGELLFNFIMGQRLNIGERSQEISVEILNQVRRILILVVITLGALTMFCMGMSHLIERVLDRLDEGSFYFTPAIGVILFFLVICIAVLIYSTNKNVWLNIFKKEKNQKEDAPASPLGNQIESVISLLVLDFIKERESNRESRKHHPKENNRGHND
jgi:Na+/H+-translocating membrane pyrophosphatase